MKANRNHSIIGFILGVILIAIMIWWIRHPDPIGSVIPDSRPDLQISAAENPKITRTETPTQRPSSSDALYHALSGQVRTERGVHVEEGTIDFSPFLGQRAPAGTPAGANVTQANISSGAFTFPSWWLEGQAPDHANFLVLDSEGIPSPVLRVEEGVDCDLILVLGEPKEFSCLVLDINGKPIPNAFVQVFSPYPFQRLGGNTNSQGILRGTIYSTTPRLGLRAFADGYSWSTIVVDLDIEPDFSVQLNPVYAAVFLVRDLAALGFVWTLSPGDKTNNCSNWPGMNYIGSRILDSLDKAAEGYRYEIRLTTVGSPLNGSIPTISLNFVGSGFDPILAAKTEMVKVAEGIPTLVKIEADMYPANLAENFPVIITIEPQTAFLAMPPQELFLPFVETKTSFSVLRRGRHLMGTTYQFRLPEGEFFVRADQGELKDMDKYTESLPKFLPGEKIYVAQASSGSQTIRLSPGEKFIRFDVRFPGGNRPTNLAVELAPNDGSSRTLWPSIGNLPLPRFIRPGSYNLHYVNRYKPKKIADMFQLLVENLVWPCPVDSDGIWLIQVQDKNLDPEAFTAG